MIKYKKQFTIVTLILIDLMALSDGHFDRQKHYHLSLQESQINVHDNIKQFAEDKLHLSEDLNDYYGFKMDPSEMTENERSYFYFVLHDFDKNRKLDGLELLLSMHHQFDDPTYDAYLYTTNQVAFNPEDPKSYYEQQNRQIETSKVAA